MMLNLQHLVLLGLLTAGLHWLFARSSVMEWFWGKLTPDGAVANLVDCAACSGFWLALGVWAMGVRPLAGIVTWWPVEGVLTGVLGIALTPVIEGVILWGLAITAIEEEVHHDEGDEKRKDAAEPAPPVPPLPPPRH